MEIGFIGLGHMGEGMARNLIRAGHAVTVYNRTAAKAAPLVREGAALAATPAEACRGEAVVTMLADDAAVEEVTLGQGGILAALPKGAVHLAMSTVSVALAEHLVRRHAAAGQAYLAAPVFGRPEVAATGKLFIVAAGAPEVFERCRPLLDAMGQRSFLIGAEPPAANLVKLSGNFLIAATIESLGEAIALIRKAGIDPAHYLEILTSTLFTAPIHRTYGQIIVEEKYRPGAFAAALGLKDIRLALEAGERHRVPLPVASLLRDHLLTVVGREDGSDWSALAEIAAENAGL